MPPNLDVLTRHAQAWLEQAVSARGTRGVLVVAILAVLAVSTWMTSCAALIDPVTAARFRNAGSISHLFEAGAPAGAVAAIRYKLVAD